MTLLSRTPYTPPPYEFMAEKNALMTGTTQAMYESSVRNVQSLSGVAVSAIEYDSGGLRITGIEVLPELAADEKIPLLMYNRGGSGNYGMLSPGQITVLMAPFAMALRCGVLASNYRGNGGSEGREEFGGGDVNDVLNLLELGKQQPWWDGKNIFMLGWSRGGMMTYLCLKRGAHITAAATGAALTDLAANLAARPDMERVYQRFATGFDVHRDEVLRERSAVCWPEKINAPLLLMHGDADDVVDVSQAHDLYAKLTALGKQVRYAEYAGGDHALKRHRAQWTEAAVDWFEMYRK